MLEKLLDLFTRKNKLTEESKKARVEVSISKGEEQTIREAEQPSENTFILSFLEKVIDQIKAEGLDTTTYAIVSSAEAEGSYSVRLQFSTGVYETGILLSPIDEEKTYLFSHCFGIPASAALEVALTRTVIEYGACLDEKGSTTDNRQSLQILLAQTRLAASLKGESVKVWDTRKLYFPKKTIPGKLPAIAAGEVIERAKKYQNKETPPEAKKESKIVEPAKILSGVRLCDIGGLPKIKKELEYLIWALQNSAKVYEEGGELGRGILLYGSSGCGKTLIARALATEAKAYFRNVDCGDFFSSYHMGTPKALKELFTECKKVDGPVILYFDEIDTLTPPRREGKQWSDLEDNRIVSIFLTEMDGMTSKKDMIIMGSTNLYNPSEGKYGIDEAMLRPGRFDKLICVSPPDLPGRKEIFFIHLQQREERAGKKLFSGIDLEELARKSEGKTGADINYIIQDVLQKRIDKIRLSGQDQPLLSQQELLDAIIQLVPRQKRNNVIGF